MVIYSLCLVNITSDSDTVDPDSVVTADLNEHVKIQRQKIKRKEKPQL